MAETAKQWVFVVTAILAFATLGGAKTDDLDVLALQDLYRSLNSPSQLTNWVVDGGDPCAEDWFGVECYKSSVMHLRLFRLNLTGSLSRKLDYLRSLKLMDLSSNNIEGSIPSSLPPIVADLNLAGNKFSQGLPTLSHLIHLRHLNLSNNALSGSLGNDFDGLVNMKEMDFSFNNFTGNLPNSLSSLINLSGLFLQNNQFTGSVHVLANLSLVTLNIENNLFSGFVPENFEAIHNLRIGGNKFDKITNYSPWNSPSKTMPKELNIRSPPPTNLSAFESDPPQLREAHKKKRPHTGGIVLLVSGLTLIVACAVITVVVHRHCAHKRAMRFLPMNSIQGTDLSPMTAEDSPDISPVIAPTRLNFLRKRTMNTFRRISFSKSIPINAKAYTLAHIQIATNGFSEENRLGKGSFSSVYRAEFPDSLILAVKNINMTPLSIIGEEKFLDVIRRASRLRHPNIVTLIGYCVEHGQHLIIYEFVGNLTLEDALHCAAYKPLSWGLRLKIAVGIARALSYMHSTIVPPMAHSNLKAANIVLDEELMPHLCDCGLAILKPLSSNSVKLKASEMAIGDGGYIAPEHVQPGIANTKADVYAFGVLLLELLTGRRPFDNSRPKSEQSLVKWASSKLHGSASLGQMVDPATSRTVPSNSLSRFADIVSMCIQPEQEIRPPMSEVVELLMTL